MYVENPLVLNLTTTEIEHIFLYYTHMCETMEKFGF